MVYLVKLQYGFSWLAGNIFNDIKQGAFCDNNTVLAFIDLRAINFKGV